MLLLPVAPDTCPLPKVIPDLEPEYPTTTIGWNGRPIEARIIMPFIFKLPGDEKEGEDED